MAIPVREMFAQPELDREVLAAWGRLVRGEVPESQPVRSVIAQSWARCRESTVDPGLHRAMGVLSEDDLRRHRELRRTFVDASAPVMAAAREFLADSDSILLLTDASGLILGVEGDPATVEMAREIQLAAGLRWDEHATGTNAIGTALAIAQGVQVHGAEHYCEGIQSWTCSAAVVHDPCDGSVLGAIDVSGMSRSYSRQSLAFVVSAAAQIEGNLKQIELSQRYRILQRCVAPLSVAHAEGVVLFDRRGFAIKANSQAAASLDERGVALAGKRPLRVEALNLEDRATAAGLPDWLHAARIEPVMDGGEQIGTLVALHGGGRRGRRGELHLPAREGATTDPFAAIVGPSGPLREAVERARTLARSRTPVLLLGETGVGKELFARGIHACGASAGAPFVAVNCAGLSRDLLSTELFGYADGAFTGARRGGMVGKLEAADGGTLFLDEIGEMPLELQGYLLRALETGEIYRVGESRPRKVGFRLVSATNREPRDDVSAGRFRMDLFYRVAVTSIRVPPLRDRPEDVVPLAEHFLRLAGQGADPRALGSDALPALKAYRWPGNVRELRNVIESSAASTNRGLLRWEDLPPEVRAATEVGTPPVLAEDGTGLSDAEVGAIRVALRAERGNLTRAARRLRIAKSTLYAKIEALGLARDVEQARAR